MIKVSVVIPVFNAAQWLRQSLDSALGQTLRDVEVICIDDGSTDESVKILEEYRARDGRVKVFAQKNSGPGAARNRGLEIARGEFVSFLDADDLYPDPDVLADLVAAAERNGADVCGGSLEELLPNGAVRSSFSGLDSALVFNCEGRVDFRDYAYDYGYYRFIYRIGFLRRVGIEFPDYRRFQDPPFMVRALSAAGSFHAVPRATYRYRVEVHNVDWRADGMRRAKDLLLGLAEIATEAKSLALPRLSETVLSQACEQYADVLLDADVMNACVLETRRLCEAFGVPSLRRLLELDYPGRTSLLYRRAKRHLRRCKVFRYLRFAADVGRYGLPYAMGRFKGARAK